MPIDPTAAVGSALGALGATAGGKLVKLGVDKVRELAEAFRNRNLAFLGDAERLEAIERERKSLEFKKYARYLRDEDRRTIVTLGLRLRKLAEKRNPTEDAEEAVERRKKVDALKWRIKKQHDIAGLHLAQAAQAEILNVLIDRHTARGQPDKETDSAIVDMIENIERFVVFVEEADAPDRLGEEILRRLRWEQPNLFFVAASGRAIPVLEDAMRRVRKEMAGYSMGTLANEWRQVRVLAADHFMPDE